MTFADAVSVSLESPGVYRGEIPTGWDIAGATNGGYLMALVTNAVLDATGSSDPVTVTTHYFAPAGPGPVRIEVDQLRAGRRLSTATARLLDAEGRLLLAALATVGSLPSIGLDDGDDGASPELVDGGPPPLDPPEDCLLIEPTDTFPPPFMAHVRLRLPTDSAGFALGRPSGHAQMQGWFGLPDDAPLDTLSTLMAADAFPPPVFNAALPIGWTPTVEMTVQVRARPAGPLLRCSFRTRFIGGGFLEADAEIWDETGGLVALSRQLALVPRA